MKDENVIYLTYALRAFSGAIKHSCIFYRRMHWGIQFRREQIPSDSHRHKMSGMFDDYPSSVKINTNFNQLGEILTKLSIHKFLAIWSIFRNFINFDQYNLLFNTFTPAFHTEWLLKSIEKAIYKEGKGKMEQPYWMKRVIGTDVREEIWITTGPWVADS